MTVDGFSTTLTTLPPDGLPMLGGLVGLTVGLLIGTALLAWATLRGESQSSLSQTLLGQTLLGQTLRHTLRRPLGHATGLARTVSAATAGVAVRAGRVGVNRPARWGVVGGVTPWRCEPVKTVGAGHPRGRVTTAGLPWRLGCGWSDPLGWFVSSLAGLTRPSTRTDHV